MSNKITLTLPDKLYLSAERLALMRIYERAWLQRSETLVVAVKRGLREPLSG